MRTGFQPRCGVLTSTQLNVPFGGTRPAPPGCELRRRPSSCSGKESVQPHTVASRSSCYLLTEVGRPWHLHVVVEVHVPGGGHGHVVARVAVRHVLARPARLVRRHRVDVDVKGLLRVLQRVPARGRGQRKSSVASSSLWTPAGAHAHAVPVIVVANPWRTSTAPLRKQQRTHEHART